MPTIFSLQKDRSKKIKSQLTYASRFCQLSLCSLLSPCHFPLSTFLFSSSLITSSVVPPSHKASSAYASSSGCLSPPGSLRPLVPLVLRFSWLSGWFSPLPGSGSRHSVRSGFSGSHQHTSAFGSLTTFVWFYSFSALSFLVGCHLPTQLVLSLSLPSVPSRHFLSLRFFQCAISGNTTTRLSAVVPRPPFPLSSTSLQSIPFSLSRSFSLISPPAWPPSPSPASAGMADPASSLSPQRQFSCQHHITITTPACPAPASQLHPPASRLPHAQRHHRSVSGQLRPPRQPSIHQIAWPRLHTGLSAVAPVLFSFIIDITISLISFRLALFSLFNTGPLLTHLIRQHRSSSYSPVIDHHSSYCSSPVRVHHRSGFLLSALVRHGSLSYLIIHHRSGFFFYHYISSPPMHRLQLPLGCQTVRLDSFSSVFLPLAPVREYPTVRLDSFSSSRPIRQGWADRRSQAELQGQLQLALNSFSSWQAPLGSAARTRLAFIVRRRVSQLTQSHISIRSHGFTFLNCHQHIVFFSSLFFSQCTLQGRTIGVLLSSGEAHKHLLARDAVHKQRYWAILQAQTASICQ